jgi:hypothetical protein
MPATKTTTATAEKRVIKAEMKTLGRNYRKLLSDALKARKAAIKEITAAERRYKIAISRIDKAVPLATAIIERRIAILEGRLAS